MATNILDKLRAKESEMEALLREARTRASSIREEALIKAKEIRDNALKEMETTVEELTAREEAGIRKAVKGIEEKASEDAASFKERAGARMDEAVRRVMEIVLEAKVDKGDDKGPDHRTKKPSR